MENDSLSSSTIKADHSIIHDSTAIDLIQTQNGKDMACLDWDPVAKVCFGKLSSIYRYLYRPVVPIDRTSKVKFFLHFRLYFYLFCKLPEWQPSVPMAIFHPQRFGTGEIGVWRSTVLFHYFPSTRLFWEEFELLYTSVKDHGYAWQKGWAHLSLEECKELMERETGPDSFWCKLASMLIDTYGDFPKFTEENKVDHILAWNDGV